MTLCISFYFIISILGIENGVFGNFRVIIRVILYRGHLQIEYYKMKIGRSE
jgi:hypothetical protein